MAHLYFDEMQRFTAIQKHKKHTKKEEERLLDISMAGRSSRSPGLEDDEEGEDEEEEATGLFPASREGSPCASCLGGDAPRHEMQRPRAAGIMFAERTRVAARKNTVSSVMDVQA